MQGGAIRFHPGFGRAKLAGILWAVWFLAALAPAPAKAQRTVEVYKAKHRTAEELVGVAAVVMADEGSVALDPGTNSLLLIGEPGAVSEALALLSTQDRAPRVVLLRYASRRIRELTDLGFQVRWTASAGAFRLGNVTAPGSSIAATSTAATQRLVESFAGRMRVAEGTTTRIETGTIVPYSAQGPSGTSTEFITATTGFDGTIRLLGDGRVEVALAAFARQLDPDRNIDTMRASTVIAVKPGSVVAVGSTDRSGAALQTDEFESSTSEDLRDETVLLIRVDVDTDEQ